MKEIDTRYSSGDLLGVDELEMVLEATLESFDAALLAIAEDFDAGEDLEPDADLEPDPHEGCSIEEQLIGAYQNHLRYPACFPLESLRANIRGVLESSQVGGMTPSGYRQECSTDLVGIAHHLHQEHHTWITARRQRFFYPSPRPTDHQESP